LAKKARVYDGTAWQELASAQTDLTAYSTTAQVSSTYATQANFPAGAWTVYTPTWTASTTNPAIGNGTITGRYTQLGKLVSFSVVVTMGSTTTYGSGDWRVSLPVTAVNANAVQTGCMYLDAGIAWYNGIGSTTYGGSTTFITLIHNKGASAISGVTSTVPFTWGNGDKFEVTGTYEAA